MLEPADGMWSRSLTCCYSDRCRLPVEIVARSAGALFSIATNGVLTWISVTLAAPCKSSTPGMKARPQHFNAHHLSYRV